MKDLFNFCIAILMLTACKPYVQREVRGFYTHKENVREGIPLLNDTLANVSHHALDKTFGYSKENPVMLGVKNVEKYGAVNGQRYLNALRDKNGNKIHFERMPPCCPFKTKNQIKQALGGSYPVGLLERYKFRLPYEDQYRVLYIDLYDEGPIKAPFNLTSVTKE